MIFKTIIRNIVPIMLQRNKVQNSKLFRANDCFLTHCKKHCASNIVIANRFYSNIVNSNPDDKVVDYNYVKKAINNTNVFIIDVREPDEIKEHGAIPNSVNIPLGTISQVFGEMSDVEFDTVFKKQKPKEDTEVICYCMIGKRSEKAQKNLASLGYKNVKNYLGSWTEWASKSS